MRHRDAPSASRTVSSCRRSEARAINRFATLAHAMSRMIATTARITVSGCS